MIDSFFTAFIVYFVVVDPIGNAPIFMAVTAHMDGAKKTRTAIEATVVATLIMLFFALCGSWVLRYLEIGRPAFKIAGGLILFLVSWEMLNSKRQARKQRQSAPLPLAPDATPTPGTSSPQKADSSDAEPENVAVFPLATPLLAGPAAILSVMVISGDFTASIVMTLTGYAALLAVMVLTGIILVMVSAADKLIDPRVTNIFSRITAIILAGLSVQYVVDGLTTLGLIPSA